MKTILFLHHSAGWGGAPNSLIKLINKLDHNKYQCKVLLLKRSAIEDKLEENGIPYSVAESDFYKKYYQFFPHSEAGYIKFYQVFKFIKLSILWLMSRYYYASRELSRHNYEIIHLNSSVLTDWLEPAAKRGKVVLHIREPFRKGRIDILNRFFRKQIIKYTDQVIAISKDNSLRINIPGKTTVVYNYSEVPANKPDEKSYSSKKVIYLGGSSTSKGFYTLIDALDYLEQDVQIIFGGNYVRKVNNSRLRGMLYMLFSKQRKRNHAIQKIESHKSAVLIGLIDNVNYYLEETCCLVSPFEVPHFSRPVIEANLYRKPAIGTNVVGMDEIIIDKENGLIVPVGNPVELARAINLLTHDPFLAKKYGEAAYVTAKQKYTCNNVWQIESIYDSLLF